MKLEKNLEHTTILDKNHDRKIFTSQGWHLMDQGRKCTINK
jgi:hypothetical protein